MFFFFFFFSFFRLFFFEHVVSKARGWSFLGWYVSGLCVFVSLFGKEGREGGKGREACGDACMHGLYD